MKLSSSLITILALFFSTLYTTNLQAQVQDCIICPDFLGVAANTENGMNISSANLSTLTKNQKKEAAIDKKKKNAVANETADKTATTENLILVFIDAVSVAINQEKTTAITNIATYNSELCGDPVDCGLVTQEEFNNAQQTFTIYPNPAHHWIVVNLKDLEVGNYKLLLKDSQGALLKERAVAEQTANLDLRMLPKGVYFVTLKNESNQHTWVQKVTVQ